MMACCLIATAGQCDREVVKLTRLWDLMNKSFVYSILSLFEPMFESSMEHDGARHGRRLPDNMTRKVIADVTTFDFLAIHEHLTNRIGECYLLGGQRS
jgi:hypothetical protein